MKRICVNVNKNRTRKYRKNIGNEPTVIEEEFLEGHDVKLSRF